MKNIVFINQDSGYLMIYIVNAHVAAGYQCTLITGRLIERDTKLDDSVNIKRIIAYNRRSKLKRLYSWIIGFIQILLIIAFR
ncbi:MAG: glycosyltransferase WbuB, partial [Salinivirgaceae bacterium]|nr:glycosyltransferase WbuB [Salinivirgaceae bacterium]